MKTATAFTFVLLLAACGGRSTATTAAQSDSTTQATASTQTATTLTPEQLGELGAQIRREPSRAPELLAQKGLTTESFEKAIREVTENREASQRYAAAYRKASG